jgi:hypothetical protein
MTEIGEILNEKQLEAMKKAGFADKIAIRAASDEDLIKVEGIGPATIIKLREWGIEEAGAGNAVSRRFLVLKCKGKEALSVRPGEIIPAEYGADEMVEKGLATWQ